MNFQMLVSVLTVPNPESKSDSKINDEKDIFYSYTYSNRKGIEWQMSPSQGLLTIMLAKKPKV